jgi:hypothetical protein
MYAKNESDVDDRMGWPKRDYVRKIAVGSNRIQQ